MSRNLALPQVSASAPMTGPGAFRPLRQNSSDAQIRESAGAPHSTLPDLFK